MTTTYTVTSAGDSIEIDGTGVRPDTPLANLLAFLAGVGRRHGLIVTATTQIGEGQPRLTRGARYAPGAAASEDVEAVRLSLQTYRAVNAEIADLMRAAKALGMGVTEIAREAGVPRDRVYRAVQPEFAPVSVEASGVVLTLVPVGKSKFPHLVGYIHDGQGHRVGSLWERMADRFRFNAVTTAPGTSAVERSGEGATIEAALRDLAEALAAQ